MSGKTSWLYETHFHTLRGSACARSRGPDYFERYKRLGYDGIIVTDHFWRGYTAVDRRLPWPEFVEAFCRGYEETKAAGDEAGLSVFFGWEETIEGDDYLVYGLDKAWLLKHPEVRGWTRWQMLEEAHRYGGCVVQAHPFRDRDYIDAIHLGPADAYEVGNSGNLPENDLQAYHWAKRQGLLMTAGSDIHSATQYEDGQLMGVRLSSPLTSIADYVAIIRGREPIGLRAPEGRFEGEPPLPRLDIWEHPQHRRPRRLAADKLFSSDAATTGRSSA